VSSDKWPDLVYGMLEASPAVPGQIRASGWPGGFFLVSVGTIQSQVLNNWNNTTSMGEPSESGVIGGASAWLGLRPERSGTLVVDTMGSAIETVLAVYQLVDVVDLQLVGSDRNSAPDGVHSRVRLEVRAGGDYLVKVDGVKGARGQIHMQWVLGRGPQVKVAFTNQEVQYGDRVVLSVGVTNAQPPAACQWWLGDQALAGATNTTLVLAQVRELDSGIYRVVVSNAIEVVESWVAQVEVAIPELTIGWEESWMRPSGLSPGPVWVIVEWSSKLEGYVLEKTENLTPPHWTTPVQILDLTGSGSRRRVAVETSVTSQFFRLRKAE